MLRFLLFLLALALVLIGILAGGCSLFFTPSLFGTGEFEGTGNLPIWGAGVAIGFVGLWLGIKIFRSLGRPAEPVAETPPDPPPEA